MSKPTNASATTAPLGQCVVCGKETKQTCSRCLNAGVQFMFFCSVDHQKLIWKEHKRICGKRSFEWPTLNAEEQKEMWELRNVEYGALEGRGAIWAEQLEEAAVAFKMISREASDNSNSPQQRRDIIFMNKLEEVSSPSKLWDLAIWNDSNRLVRATAFMVKLTKGPRAPSEPLYTIDAVRRLISEDPFGFVAWIMDPHAPKETPDLDEALRLETALSLPGNDHFSTFQHRLLILASLVKGEVLESNGVRSFGSSAQYERFFLHSVNTCLSLGIQSTTKEFGNPIGDLIVRLFRSLGISPKKA